MHAPERTLLVAPPGQPPAAMSYDAFLSYTHSDRPVATGIQQALHRIGRRVGQLRALRVFRDDTNLEASPDLWGKITAAMSQARSMVVVLSPNAARSTWVNAEVTHWLQQRGGPPPLIVLAGGRLDWDKVNRCFNPLTSDAAPPVLTIPGVLPAEPFFLDVSHDGPPWSASAAGFRDKMTALAAPLHGKPKDELAGDDLREHRRFRRLRAAAVAGLAVLTIVAITAGGIALVQRRAAIEQRDEAVAARLTAEARSMFDDNGSGNDVQAIQELLAGRAISKHPDDGALYNAVVAKANMLRIIDTGAPAYGGATSPDGKRIVTGSAAKAVYIWDIKTGQPVGAPLEGHTDVVSGVAWSGDGRLIATASADSTVRLWNADAGKQIGAPGRGHTGLVNAVTFNRDNTLMATAGQDSTVRLWTVRDSGPQLVTTLTGHVGEVRAVAFSPDGSRLASVGGDAVVRLWDVASQQPVPVPFQTPSTMFFGVSWSPDGQSLATSGWDGVIRLWDANSGQQLGMFEGHRAPVINTVFTADGRWLLSGSFDKTVRMWDVASRQQIGDPLRGFDGGVAVNVARDGHLAAVSNDHTIRLFDILMGQPLGSHAGIVSAVKHSPDRDLFASGSWDGTVALWEPSTRKLIGVVGGQGQPVVGVSFGPEGRLLIARADATVQVWDVDDTQAPLRTIKICWPIGGYALSPDGRLLAVGCRMDQRVQLWDLSRDDTSAPIELPDPRGQVSAVAFSADGERFATSSGKTIQLWNSRTHEPIGRPLAGHEDIVTSLAFNRSGDRLVSASGDNTIRLWNLDASTSIAATPPEGNTITALDMSGDGEHVVSGSFDGTVRLWSVAGDRIQPVGRPMSGHFGMVSTVDFSPDGSHFLSGSADHFVRVWPVAASPDELCAKLAANMNLDQWNKWVSRDIPYQKACPDLP